VPGRVLLVGAVGGSLRVLRDGDARAAFGCPNVFGSVPDSVVAQDPP